MHASDNPLEPPPKINNIPQFTHVNKLTSDISLTIPTASSNTDLKCFSFNWLLDRNKQKHLPF